MENNFISLNCLLPGSLAKVKFINAEGVYRRRLLDLGLVADTEIEAVKKSPFGDPVAYRIRGALIALRSDEAVLILVENIVNSKEEEL